MRKHFTFLFFFIARLVLADTPPKQSIIRFTENKHQWDDVFLFRAQLDGGSVWMQKNAFIYSFYDKETYRSIHANPKAQPVSSIKTSGFKLNFVSSDPGVVITASAEAKDYCNYFNGNDPSHWAGNVKNYGKLVYKNLWQNIDMEILGEDNSLKSNFYIHPGADPSLIQLKYDKAQKISLHNNEITIQTGLNEITEHRPYCYQIINGKPVFIECSFVLKENVISFSFPRGFDKTKELIIEPVLVFACSSGSTADNFGMTATYDSLGNLYSGGTCFDQGYTVINPYDSTYNGVVSYGMTDVVISKYDSSGTFLHYSTYFGGGLSSEIVTSLIIDDQNNLYLHGATGSADFPITTNAYDNTFNGGDSVEFMFNGTYFYHGTDLYIAKLSSGGDQLLASTYIGGSGNDGVNTNNKIAPYVAALYGITVYGEYPPDSLQYNYGDQYRGELQLDSHGNPLICSSSRSVDFPTINAIDNSLGGWQDAVVCKLDQNLTQLLWSTYIGGSDNDAGYSLVLTKNDEVFITGGTRSADFPTTSNAFQQSYQGGKCDGYIAKISTDGTTLLAATFIGTSLYDQSFLVQTDANSNVYVFGQSLGNMPVINSGFFIPNGKQFVTKLDSSFSLMLFSTAFGDGTANINISPSAFLVDDNENIYLSGWGGNIVMGPGTFNMPITSNAIQPSNPDGFNFYLMGLSKNAQCLLFGSYFGGSLSHEHVDGGTSRFSKDGILYQSVCAGCGGHDDFPVTAGAWPTSQYGSNWNQSSNCNNGTFKLKLDTSCSMVINAVNHFPPNQNTIAVYPNPASENLTIEFSGVKENFIYTIFDIEGKEVKEKNVKGSEKLFSVSIKELVKGTYLLKVSSDDKIFTKVFIKE